MSTKKTPLSFEIDVALAAKLDQLRKQLGNVSSSKLIDYAIENYDYGKVAKASAGERRQLSVRLADDKRTSLESISKRQKVSMAYMIRIALESLLEGASKKTAVSALKKEITPVAAPAKKAVKKAAKKAAKKAVAKKATKKAAKKAVKKVVAKKAAKKAAKKVVAKKAAKKAVAKKAVKKAAKKAVAKKAVKKAAKKPAAKPAKVVKPKKVAKAGKKAAKKKSKKAGKKK